MEPVMQREGNLRLVSREVQGWPFAAEELLSPVDEALAAQQDGAIAGYGPIQVWINLPPDDPDPRTWQVQLGRACTGIPSVRSPLLLEDYSNLVAVTLPHHGPVRDLARSHRLASDFAQSQGARCRPYWRVRLERSPTPDGQGILNTFVSVFVDR